MDLNKLSGIVITALGVIYTALSYNLPRATIGKPMDPVVFPLILGIGMTVCGILLFIKKEEKKESTHNEKEIKSVKKWTLRGISQDTKLIIFTCIMGILYGLLFQPLGYVLSTIVFMGSLLFALNDGIKKWKTNVLVAVGFSVCIYVLFYHFLGIPLPMMPILEI